MLAILDFAQQLDAGIACFIDGEYNPHGKAVFSVGTTAEPELLSQAETHG